MEKNIEQKIKELIEQIPKASETDKREIIEPQLKELYQKKYFDYEGKPLF